jgi:hypothetical protein
MLHGLAALVCNRARLLVRFNGRGTAFALLLMAPGQRPKLNNDAQRQAGLL